MKCVNCGPEVTLIIGSVFNFQFGSFVFLEIDSLRKVN